MNKLVFKLFYSKWTFALFFMIAVLLAGCSPATTGSIVKHVPAETNKNPEAYFCPRQDCGRILESHIKDANFSVHCAFYDIDLKNVINALARKSKSTDVKLAMDSSNYEGQVNGNGVKQDNDKQLMHNKFCVIDNGVVITGSFNPTDNDNNYNNNNMLVVFSNALAENYEDEFDELWDGKFGSGNKVKHPELHVNNIKIENYFCPEDECASKIVDLIRNAEKSVYFMSFSFTNGEIGDALIAKSDLDVRGIFDAQQSSNKYSQLKRLQQFGINAKKDSNKYKMHHKVFIIDNETIVTGSFNPTSSADARNDENLLVLHDKKFANVFLEEFDSLWN